MFYSFLKKLLFAFGILIASFTGFVGNNTKTGSLKDNSLLLPLAEADVPSCDYSTWTQAQCDFYFYGIGSGGGGDGGCCSDASNDSGSGGCAADASGGGCGGCGGCADAGADSDGGGCGGCGGSDAV